jgi:acyl-CoA synthetase (AMP-forming)/AMP-acid ligase II
MWDPLPLFHMASILPLFALMHEAGTFLTDHTVNIDRAVEQIHNEQATFLYPAFPAIMADLIAHRDLKPETLRRIRLINNVAHTEVLEANMAAMPLATHISAYGMTELSGIASHTDPADPAEDRARNCGQPYPGVEVSIRDPETNQPVDEGCQGEICVKGFSVFQGYYNQPEENAKAFDADGWFHTGDMGSLDDRGRICFHGRLKDMLKVGGENVSPLEIEAWLSTHPGIAMAQVIGAPDERLQEVPVAFIELHPDASVTEADIVAYCAGQIASYKVPRRVIFVSEWPMSATKIQKAALREWL